MNILSEKQMRDEAFEKHRRDQQKSFDAVPFWEKLRWLEEMHRLSLQMQKQPHQQKES